MSWVKVDDQLHANPKVLEVSLSARGLWITCLSWVGDKESDGVLPASIVRLHAGAMFDELSAELVAAGLWTRAANGKDFEYHDFRQHIIPRDSRRLVWDSLRAELAPLVFARDEHCCVYCGATEDLTVDHVLPLSRGGTNDLSNLVTACRPCNSSKNAKTPEEWEAVRR